MLNLAQVNKQACARGEGAFAEGESRILHNIPAFPAQGAGWIFMEAWTEGGLCFFNVLHVFLKIDRLKGKTDAARRIHG